MQAVSSPRGRGLCLASVSSGPSCSCPSADLPPCRNGVLQAQCPFEKTIPEDVESAEAEFATQSRGQPLPSLVVLCHQVSFKPGFDLLRAVELALVRWGLIFPKRVPSAVEGLAQVRAVVRIRLFVEAWFFDATAFRLDVGRNGMRSLPEQPGHWEAGAAGARDSLSSPVRASPNDSSGSRSYRIDACGPTV